MPSTFSYSESLAALADLAIQPISVLSFEFSILSCIVSLSNFSTFQLVLMTLAPSPLTPHCSLLLFAPYVLRLGARASSSDFLFLSPQSSVLNPVSALPLSVLSPKSCLSTSPLSPQS